MQRLHWQHQAPATQPCAPGDRGRHDGSGFDIEVSFADVAVSCRLPRVVPVMQPATFESDDLSLSLTGMLGRHTLHYRAEILLFRDRATSVGQPNGPFTVASQLTQPDPYNHVGDGGGLAEVLLGLPDGGSVDPLRLPLRGIQLLCRLCAQDAWKVRHDLTLTPGWRGETVTLSRDRSCRPAGGYANCLNPIGGKIVGFIVSCCRTQSWTDHNSPAQTFGLREALGTLLPNSASR